MSTPPRARQPLPAADPGTPVLAGRYRLHGVVGVGGVAVVHEATDLRLDRRVAVKLLRDPAHDETDRARFLAEAQLLGRLSHRGLVRVLDAGVEDERPFLVLELVRGTSWAAALADENAVPLPPERVAALGADIAAALAHVHAAGIVHRDVKPGNVLLDEAGSPKLADFGIARLVDDTRHHTRTGTVVGTVAYLAPEQVAGEPVTTAVDIYSLGLVLLEALTGSRPYAGTSVETALARLHRPPEIPANLPPGWRDLLLDMTARDPRARPTAAQVAERLRRAPAPVTATSSARPGRSPRLALAGVAAALAVLGVAGWTAAPLASGQAATAAAHRLPPRGGPAASAPEPEAEVAPAAVSLAPATPAAGPQHRTQAPHRPARGHAPHPARHHHGHGPKKHGPGGKHDGKHGHKHGPKHGHKHGHKH